MIQVPITVTEFVLAIDAAKFRFVASRIRNLQIKNHGPDETWASIFQSELIGVCGEIALAKWKDRWFVPTVFSFHDTPDCLTEDVRATTRQDGRMIVRKDDPDDRKCVLTIVSLHPQNPHVGLAGWIRYREAKEDRFTMNPHSIGNAWFAPQSILHTMQTLDEETPF